MKNKRTTILVVIITLSLVIGTVALRKITTSKVDDLPTFIQSPWALNVSPVEVGNVTRGFPVLATLTAITDITVASQISGIISLTGPREGVKVKKGDIIAEILVEDLLEERAGIIRERTVALSEQERTASELVRQQELIKAKLTLQELVDTKKAAAIAASNQVVIVDKKLAAINVRISYGIIRAPQDAIIAEKLVETGDIAQPGKALYKLTVDSAAIINLQLPQQVLENTHVGSKVLLTHRNKKETVLLTRIFPALSEHNVGSVEADVSGMPFSLRNGAKISGRVIIEEIQNSIIVPHRAVLVNSKDKTKGFVYKRVNDNGIEKIVKVELDIVLKGHEGFAVLANLSAGDEVVTAHQSVLMQLKNNDLILASEENHNEF